MNRVGLRIRSIELRNVHLKTLEFLIGINDIAARLQIGKSELRIRKLLVGIVPVVLRHLGCIMMTGSEINLQLFLLTEAEERFHPFLVAHAADSGSADTEAGVELLDGKEGFLKKAEILFHVRILPEARKVGLVPNLNRPGINLLAVALHKVRKRNRDKLGPVLIILRGRRVALPVENRIVAACHLLRHETKLQKRHDVPLEISVHHAVQIREVIFDCLFLREPVLPLLVDCHVIREQAVAADMLKSDDVLYKGQLLQIFLRQCKSRTSGTDTEVDIVPEIDFFRALKRYVKLHKNKPLSLSSRAFTAYGKCDISPSAKNKAVC